MMIMMAITIIKTMIKTVINSTSLNSTSTVK